MKTETLRAEAVASQNQHAGAFPPVKGSALFVPLKREYYERFRDGEKAVEFRPYGPRWNERTCVAGRRVVLSLGYGQRHRMTGIVTSFRVADESERAEIPGWAACYGPGDRRPIACIGIYVDYDARVAGGFQQNAKVSQTNREGNAAQPEM